MLAGGSSGAPWVRPDGSRAVFRRGDGLLLLVQVATWLALQPDLQYVIAPNTSALHDALALQLSFELTL